MNPPRDRPVSSSSRAPDWAASGRRWIKWVLNNMPLILFVGVFILFGTLSSKFLTGANLVNILIHSSSTAIIAIGMTFVLLTAGVDLSVGAIMFVSAAIAGKMALHGLPFPLALGVIIAVGMIYGAFNAFFITQLRIMAFVVTLATLHLGRGLALWITETRAMNLPENFLQLGASDVLGIPTPIVVFLTVMVMAHAVLSHTPFGRQIYAVGHDQETARKAGVATGRILVSVYIISGLCASIGGIVALSQLGAVSPTFGFEREFTAIAAAVLGGASLFGGRGKVFPGTVLGAVLIHTIENGLNVMGANPYLYPMVTSGIIFFAVFIDSVRHGLLARLGRRQIRRQPLPIKGGAGEYP